MRRFPAVAIAALLLASCAGAPGEEGPTPLADIDSFEDCAAAGYPIMESYPEQCATPDGRSFTRDISGDQSSSVPSTDAAFHEVSYPAMMRKQFSGSDLKLINVQSENAVYTRHTISYKSGDLTISGIMNIPKGQGPFPLLILNHGHIDTAIYTNGRGLKREQDYLARRGYAVLHTDYRNHAFSSKDPDADLKFRLGYAEDSINAILAVQAAKLPTIDASRVGMLGHSMGGGVTLGALISAPELIDAAVLFAPVSGDARLNYERWTMRRPEQAESMREAYGSPEESPEFWDNVSAISFLDHIKAPVMIHHGTADDSVPVEWSQDLEKRLDEAGAEVTYHEYPGEPHEFIRQWGTVMERSLAFFDARLKGG